MSFEPCIDHVEQVQAEAAQELAGLAEARQRESWDEGLSWYRDKALTLHREPEVYLVGQTQVNENWLESFLTDHGVENWQSDTDIGGQKLAEMAGRICYMSFARPRPGGNDAYLKHLIEVGHTSVLEHCQFSFILTGVSRSFSHELVRHRHASYSQLSQRYVDESEVGWVEPRLIAEDPDLHEDFVLFAQIVQKMYQRWSDRLTASVARKYPSLSQTDQRKMARQTARSCLPNFTETKVMVSMNVRALRHFFLLRGSLAADDEMRRVALAVFRKISAAAPAFFADLVIHEAEGMEYLASPHKA